MAAVRIIHDKDALGTALAALRSEGGGIAFVPTMGALHAGHLALVREGRRRARHLVASIFVNPAQFGPAEDLAGYPRQIDADAQLLEREGCALLWAPDVATMYPDGFATRVSVAGLGDDLEGAARPGHFDGVATVVAKLLGQVRPEVAIFGEKDYQQLAIVCRLVVDLDLGVGIVGVPTRRDADGLALSSRNAYLTSSERIAARALPRALLEAALAIREGGVVAEALAAARRTLDIAFDAVDYVELRDAATLAPLTSVTAPARLLAAARIGRTRLLDNVEVPPQPPR